MTETVKYRCFRRRWWRDAPGYPGGLAPATGARKTTLCVALSREEAQKFCKEWNESHNPGRYGIKAEFEACA